MKIPKWEHIGKEYKAVTNSYRLKKGEQFIIKEDRFLIMFEQELYWLQGLENSEGKLTLVNIHTKGERKIKPTPLKFVIKA